MVSKRAPFQKKSFRDNDNEYNGDLRDRWKGEQRAMMKFGKETSSGEKNHGPAILDQTAIE